MIEHPQQQKQRTEQNSMHTKYDESQFSTSAVDYISIFIFFSF